MTKAALTNHFWLVVANLLDRRTRLGETCFALLFILGAVLAGRAVRMAVHRYLDKTERAGADPTAIRFLGQLANLGVYIYAFIIYSQYNSSLQRLGTAWLASVGVVSVVVGLAAQSTLGNLISGISLVLYRPFKIGDRLQVNIPTGPETGVVQSINLGYTILRTSDDRQLLIPNSAMASQACLNLAQAQARVSCVISVTVAPGTNMAAARVILTEAARGNPKTTHVESCHVTALSAAGSTLTLNASCANSQDAAQLKSDLLETAQKQFEAAGIKLA